MFTFHLIQSTEQAAVSVLRNSTLATLIFSVVQPTVIKWCKSKKAHQEKCRDTRKCWSIIWEEIKLNNFKWFALLMTQGTANQVTTKKWENQGSGRAPAASAWWGWLDRIITPLKPLSRLEVNLQGSNPLWNAPSLSKELQLSEQHFQSRTSPWVEGLAGQHRESPSPVLTPALGWWISFPPAPNAFHREITLPAL